jgi:uncharacterized protein YhjY with autotransporter beta-barrel domain
MKRPPAPNPTSAISTKIFLRFAAAFAAASVFVLAMRPCEAVAGLLIDPSGSTALILPGVDDIVSPGRSLGFTGNFFGVPLATVDLSSNGNLNFSNSNSFGNGAFPSSAVGGAGIVAPFWDDLVTGTGSVLEKVSVGNYYAATWLDNRGFGSGGNFTFQAAWFGSAQTVNGISFLPDDIVFGYETVSGALSATVGLNKGDGVNSAVLPGTTDGQITEPSLLPLGPTQYLLFRPNGAGSYNVIFLDLAQIAQLALPQSLGDVGLGVAKASTQNVDGRMAGLNAINGAIGAQIGLAARYGSKGGELVSLAVDGKKAVAYKQTAPAVRPLELYAIGVGSTTDRETVNGVPGFGGWTESATAGLEYGITDQLTLGLALGYVHNNTDIAANNGSVTVDGGAVSAYAAWSRNDLYVNGLYNFAFAENDIRHDSPIGVARAKPNSYSHTVQLSTGYNFMNYPGIVSGPMASLRYVHGDIDGYTESTGTTVASQSYNSLVSQFGWQASFPRRVRFGVLTPQLWAAWAHEYMNRSRSVSATFAGVTVTGATADPQTDYVALGFGLLAELGERISLNLGYEADVGKTQVTHTISLRGGMKF